MKEFCIYCRWNGGTPFIQGTYKTIEGAQRQLYDMIALEDERERTYYVDNDFFKNKHALVGRLKYYRIDCREVSQWLPYSEEKALQSHDRKILSFNEIKYKTM